MATGAWYYSNGEKETGPLSSAELKHHAFQGLISPTDLVWKQGSTRKSRAGSIKGLFTAVKAKPKAPPAIPKMPEGHRTPEPSPVAPPGTLPPVPDQAPRFSQWYRNTWIFGLRWFIQLPIWLFYGFIWIPLWYFVSTTGRGGIKARWQKLPLDGKAMCCTPMIILVVLAVAAFRQPLQTAVSTSDSYFGGTPNESSETPAEETSGLPESFRDTLDTSWTYPVPDLQKVAFWPREESSRSGDKRPLNPFQHDNYIIFSGMTDHRMSDGTFRIWNPATDTEIVAASDECDYFSRPSAFSESGRLLACVDGDFLRIWNLESDAATLARTVPVPEGRRWSDIRWNADTAVYLETSIESSSWLQVVELPFGKRESESVESLFSVDSNKIRSDYGSRHTEFSPTHRQVFLGQDRHSSSGGISTLSVGESPRKPKHEPAYNPSQGSREALTPGFRAGIQQYNNARRFFSFSNPNLIGVTGKQGFQCLDVRDWSIVGTIKPDLPTTQNSWGGVLAASPDDQLLAGAVVRELRTSRDKQIQSTIRIWDIKTSRTVFEQSLKGKLVTLGFVDDGASIFGALLLLDHYNDEARRAEMNFSMFRADISTGSIEYQADVVTVPTNVWLSPDGRYLAFGNGVWDRKAMEQIEHLLDEGDRLYESEQWEDARRHYATVLLDPFARSMTWKNDKEFPAAWSRCFDCYAAESRDTDAEAILTFCDNNSISITPDLDQGQSLLGDIRTRQQEERSRLVEEQRRKSEDALATFRSSNQQKHIPSNQLTRSEFMDVLRSTMSRGMLQDGAVNAIFEDYAFQDRIGPPDRNQSFVDSKRLYYYRCRDGVVCLTIYSVRSMVIVEDFDLL